MLSDLLQGKAEVIDKVMKSVEPELRQALLELVVKLKEMRNVQQYSERLQSQKIKDKMEQKRHEKDRLKEELGSAYESSEESNYDDLDIKGQDDESSNSQNIPPDLTNQYIEGEFVQQNSDSLTQNAQNETKQSENENGLPPNERQDSGNIEQQQQQQEITPQETDRQNSSIKNKYYEGNGIQEENEDKEHEELERLEPEFRIKHKHKVMNSRNKFNPIRYLAKRLKEIIGKPLPEEDSFLEIQETQQFDMNLLNQINSQEIPTEDKEQKQEEKEQNKEEVTQSQQQQQQQQYK